MADERYEIAPGGRTKSWIDLESAQNFVRPPLYKYIEEYASRVFAEKPRGQKYDTRWELLQDSSLQEFICPWCGKPVKCDLWISLNNSTHLAYSLCPEEDEFLEQLSVICHNHQVYSGKRIIFEMSNDLWDIYMDKKEDVMGVHT